jgi:hypothetical protein
MGHVQNTWQTRHRRRPYAPQSDRLRQEIGVGDRKRRFSQGAGMTRTELNLVAFVPGAHLFCDCRDNTAFARHMQARIDGN